MENQIEKLKIFEEKEWVTKSNEKIKIKNLSLSHLENIVKYLRRTFNSLENPIIVCPSFQGEMAQYYAMMEWESSIRQYEELKTTLELFECYYRLKCL